MTTAPAQRSDGILRVVMWLDAFWSATVTLIAVGGSVVVALVDVPAGVAASIGVSAAVAAVFLAACGAVTGFVLLGRMNCGHYELPHDLRIPLPRRMVPLADGAGAHDDEGRPRQESNL